MVGTLVATGELAAGALLGAEGTGATAGATAGFGASAEAGAGASVWSTRFDSFIQGVKMMLSPAH